MGATQHDVHIDVPLSNIAIGYKPFGFIAEQLAPIVPVKKQSDGYYIWSVADAFRAEDDYRAPTAEANVMEYSVNSDKYFADNYALKDRISYEDLKNADGSWSFTERGARAERIKDKLYLNWEKRVALQVTSGSNVGSYSNTGSAWTDGTNSDPRGDIDTALNVVLDTTGYRPNRIVFGEYAWRNFRSAAVVRNYLYGSAGANIGPEGRNVTVENARALFEVEQVLIGRAYYNTTEEGQTASLAQLWNDNVLVYYAPLTPRKDVPSFMYSFRWDAVPGMSMQAEVFDLPRNKAEEIQLGYYQDEKITASTLGFLIRGVGSSQ